MSERLGDRCRRIAAEARARRIARERELHAQFEILGREAWRQGDFIGRAEIEASFEATQMRCRLHPPAATDGVDTWAAFWRGFERAARMDGFLAKISREDWVAPAHEKGWVWVVSVIVSWDLEVKPMPEDDEP